VRSSDFTDPLEAYEDPRPTIKGVLRWLPTTLSPFIPSGMRHNAMPRAGAMARWAHGFYVWGEVKWKVAPW
jgi:hypothetical protein